MPISAWLLPIHSLLHSRPYSIRCWCWIQVLLRFVRRFGSFEESSFYSIDFNFAFPLHFKTTDGQANTILLYRICFSVMWSFILIFFLCEFGEIVATQFDMFHVEFSKCKWYLLPLEMQRMLLILLADVQPMTIRGYGDVMCTRVTFKKVCSAL